MVKKNVKKKYLGNIPSSYFDIIIFKINRLKKERGIHIISYSLDRPKVDYYLDIFNEIVINKDKVIKMINKF